MIEDRGSSDCGLRLATEPPQTQRRRGKDIAEKASFLFLLCGCGVSVAKHCNPQSAIRRGAMNYDIPSITGRMVAEVLAGFRKSPLAGDALRIRGVDRFALAWAGEDAPHCLADGFCEISFAVGVVVPDGAGSGAESFVACADGNDRHGGRRSSASDRGACREIGRRRGPQ